MKNSSTLQLLLLYLVVLGTSVECNLTPQIAKLLHNSKIERANYEGPIVEPCGDSSHVIFDKIVGGTDAKPHEFPWMISVQALSDGKYTHICGAAIIHESHILTAAHCATLDPSNLLVGAGLHNISDRHSADSQYRNVSKIYTDHFDHQKFSNDIAVLELTEPLDLKKGIISPICLPRGDEEFADVVGAAGWGKTTKKRGGLSQILQRVELDKISPAKCKAYYEDNDQGHLMHDCQICTLTPNKDFCTAKDSGGSLMCYDPKSKRMFACGVMSWSLCARKDAPGVSTETACFTPWIMEKIK